MSLVRERATAVATFLLGATWLFAALSKLSGPLEAYEFAARVVPAGVTAKGAVAATVGAEAALGAAMMLRACVGLWPSLVGLALATAALLMVRAAEGGMVPCGCMGESLGATIDQALVRNAVLAAPIVALIVWRRVRAPA
jgi:hypothetical protein